VTTEQDLLERAAAGDLDAFTSLIESRRARVVRIAFNLTGDRELAKDVAQEVFLRLFRVIHRFRKGARFDPWVYRMTIHLGIDALRRERPHRQTASIEDLAGHPGAEAGPLPAPAGAPGGQELGRLFVLLTSRLGRKQRTAFLLREIEGLTTEEVAAVLRTTESTVRNHILQARRILQDALKREFPEYLPRERSQKGLDGSRTRAVDTKDTGSGNTETP
jgi:RNA polymerase sigma-70 factor (ECF subfamily)